MHMKVYILTRRRALAREHEHTGVKKHRAQLFHQDMQQYVNCHYGGHVSYRSVNKGKVNG